MNNILMNNFLIESYKKTLLGLSSYLGEGYEIILYCPKNNTYYVSEIINKMSHSLSIGDMCSDFVLKLINKIKSDGTKDSISYFSRDSLGEPLKSSLILIRDIENNIIAVMSINFYLNTPFTRVMGTFIPEHNSMQKNPILDNNFDNTDNLILSAYQLAKYKVENDTSIPTIEKNKSIILLLSNEGIFNIKDSVIKVSQLMNISKNTVYLHLRNINKK